jgi:serine/threonine protein kinase
MMLSWWLLLLLPGTWSHSVRCVLVHSFDQLQTRQLVALKVSSLERLQHALVTRSTPENPIEEARLLKQLHNGAGGPGHRNVMRLVDEYILDGAHFAALELADQGDLFGVIERHGRLSESVVRKLFLQMVDGVRYLHDCGLAHLDLKPENLLFTSAGEVKICDFGMARVVAPSRYKAAALASASAAATAEMKSLNFTPKTLQGAVGTTMYAQTLGSCLASNLI